MSKYDTILFDLDGTLLDTSKGILKSVDYTISKMGFTDIPLEKKKKFIGPPIQVSFQNTYNLDLKKANMAASVFRERYSTVDLFEAELYDGIIDLLNYLKLHNFKVGVATYKREDYAKRLLEKFKISKYFNCIEGSDFEGKYTKQDIINNCIKKLKNNKDEILMIGDTENDKIGADKVGIDFLAVAYGFGYNRNNSCNIFYCNNPKEIIYYLKQKN